MNASNNDYWVSGGGAHKFAEVARAAMGVEIVPFKEMQSLICGVDFLHCCGPDDEVFTVGEDGLDLPVSWPEPLYPYLLASMGSGVSILRVEARDRFERVGGTRV